MIPTITKPLRHKAPEKEELQEWIRLGLLPFLQQVRQFADYVNTVQVATTTAATGVMTTIWTSADIAVGQSALIDTTVIGIATGACSVFKITGTFRNGGALAQEGATSAPYTQNTAGFAVQYLVVGNHVEVQVQDDGALSVQWEATVGATEIGP